MIFVKWIKLLLSLAPKKPNTTPMRIVLMPCAIAQAKVTLVTSAVVHCSFLAIAIMGSQ